MVELLADRSTPSTNICPRTALQNVVKNGALDHGLDFLIGFEIEFVSLQTSSIGELASLSSHPGHYSVAGLRESYFQYVEGCVVKLSAAGVRVEGFHAEGHSEQYEISLAPRAPLQAVDELVAAHDIIKSCIAAHSYVATMSPKPIIARRNTPSAR